jgi:hypothetical protein
LCNRTVDQRRGPDFEVTPKSHVKAVVFAVDDLGVPNTV